MATRVRARVDARTKSADKTGEHLIDSSLMNEIIEIVRAHELNFAIEFVPHEIDGGPWFFSVFKSDTADCLFCFEGDTLREAVEDTVDRLKEIYQEPVL